MQSSALDNFRLELGQSSEIGLAVALFIIMLSVALDLRVSHFAQITKRPIPFFAGVIGQLIGLPLATYILCLLLNPHPTVALGMLIVACCPGGTVSNLLTMLGRGNTALSVSLTATSSLFAAFMAPLTILFWVSIYAPTADLLQEVGFNPLNFLKTTFFLLAVPLGIGMLAQWKFPIPMSKIHKPMAALAISLLLLIIILALRANWSGFTNLGWPLFFGLIGITVLHNLVAFGIGLTAGMIARADRKDRRALIMEIGIQNSGLAIVIILASLEGFGGAAAVIGLWGTWHIIAGLALVAIFRVQDRGGKNV